MKFSRISHERNSSVNPSLDQLQYVKNGHTILNRFYVGPCEKIRSLFSILGHKFCKGRESLFLSRIK